MLFKRPMAVILITRLVPPQLISGKVRPVIGIRPTFTLICMSVCVTSIAVIPMAINLPNGSVFCPAISRAHAISIAYKRSKPTQPRKPN